DGLVLARSGMHHSANYRSAMLFGTAKKVTGRANKVERMRIFIEQMFPGRWEQLREVNEQEIKATTILGMPIDEAAAKLRTGGPVDDEEDYGHPVWAGVIPFMPRTPDKPVPDDHQDPGTAMPDHVRHYRVARTVS
ncbi:MAG: pyridoxamine 5'-phosphate oxidase family protein, partial [Alphaproteobacteria bacterium]|nr:pyridoxamine 5'-phosphate oxidase family protein [Alphaproteobacteria bacterium]